MSLVERLEKLAKELDRQRWQGHIYCPDKAEQSDIVAEAARTIACQNEVLKLQAARLGKNGNS